MSLNQKESTQITQKWVRTLNKVSKAIRIGGLKGYSALNPLTPNVLQILKYSRNRGEKLWKLTTKR